MKIHLQELGDGPRRFDFDIEEATFQTYLKEVDELYYARNGALEARLEVEKIDDLILLSGKVSGRAGFECARCLKDLDRPIDMSLRWTFVPRKSMLSGGLTAEEEYELTADDLDVSFFDGDEIDLQDVVREAILLELDTAPRCAIDDCAGNLYGSASSQPDSAPSEEAIDPRWAKLAEMKANLKN